MPPTKSKSRRSCYEVACGLLARREHSRLELERKLSTRGFADIEVDDLLADFVTRGWLSDSRFAEEYTRMRVNKGFGPLRISSELRARGISSELIAAAFSDYDNEWQHRLTTLHDKKFGYIPDDFSERAKQSRFLQYRGFYPEHIRTLLG